LTTTGTPWSTAVEGGDPIEVRLHELFAGELAVSDRRGGLRERQLGEVGNSPFRAPPPVPTRGPNLARPAVDQ
jgi:hypothetical protein